MPRSAHPAWLCPSGALTVLICACQAQEQGTQVHVSTMSSEVAASVRVQVSGAIQPPLSSVTPPARVIASRANDSSALRAPESTTATVDSSGLAKSTGATATHADSTSSHARTTPSKAHTTAPIEPLKAVQSPVVSGEGFRVYLQAVSPIAVGQTHDFHAVVDPQFPFKSNDKYPLRFVTSNIYGVTMTNTPVARASITKERTKLTIEVTGARPGKGSLEGTLHFSVCTDEKCLVERASLQVAFDVTDKSVD
jgi:hypothetical protein